MGGVVVVAVSGGKINEKDKNNFLRAQTMQRHYYYNRYHFSSFCTLAARSRTKPSTEYSASAVTVSFGPSGMSARIYIEDS